MAGRTSMRAQRILRRGSSGGGLSIPGQRCTSLTWIRISKLIVNRCAGVSERITAMTMAGGPAEAGTARSVIALLAPTLGFQKAEEVVGVALKRLGLKDGRLS